MAHPRHLQGQQGLQAHRARIASRLPDRTQDGNHPSAIRAPYVWDLSPDGGRIAVLKRSGTRIYILSLNSHSVQEIAAKDWNSFEAMDWASDGKGLFASSLARQSSVLLYVDLRGKACALWEQRGWAGTRGVPSPDGRHLAVVGFTRDSNVWMLENF